MDLNPGENSLLILPENFYNSFAKLLLGSNKNGLAFKIDLNENNIIDFPWQIKSKGRILLPDGQSNDSSVKDDILNILKQKRETLEKTLLILFQNANNIEAVHKIQVNAKTLRSLLDFLRPFTDQEKNKFLRDFLKKLALKFSRIREEDVLLKQIENYQKKTMIS
ncbi:CHAD domain-containing protein [uncultured Peptoniphilus sp.]|uniref:CHAD domain-containing protein n=1 Tax=uncultured Peptoniphilus sp. TaxID=254354 RepID=UPI002804A2D5|nr:CHAD domain-containing protein [uncultured Peptoniphilus sp.]